MFLEEKQRNGIGRKVANQSIHKSRMLLTNNNRKIIFENHKRVQKVGFTIFTDLTIKGYKKTVSSKGINFQKEIGKYFYIPKRENEQQTIKVDYVFNTPIGVKEFLSIPSIIYSENGIFTTRKNKKKIRSVVFLKPKNEFILRELRELTKKYQKITYIIHKQLTPTKMCMRLKSIRERTAERLDINFSKLELIIAGGRQSAQFEIYRDKYNQVFIKSSAKINRWGKVTLSSELNNHIIDFFKYKEFVCKKDEDSPIIIPTVTREINSMTKIEVNFPHYSNKKEQISLIVTHPDFKLTVETLADFRMKNQLLEIGYPIKSFYSRYFNGYHTERKIEENMRLIIRNAFSSSKFKIFSDAQIVVDYPFENEFGNKHAFDDFIINKDENSLILVEYKTIFGKTSIYRETDYAIARLQHFQRKLGERVYLVLLINGELYSNNKKITKEFGKAINIVLIGKNDLEEILENPTLLIDRVNLLKDNKKVQLKTEKDFQISTLYKSKQNLSKVTQNVLEKNEKQLFNKVPNNFEFYTTMNINNSGREFEQEVQELLESDGFNVSSNLIIRYYKRRMEIDMLAFKDDRMMVVSCRNALNVNCIMSFRLDIKLKAYKIEQRMRLLNANSARLYIKVTNENYTKLVEFEGKWVDNVEIIFITT